LHEIFRKCWQRASEQMIKFWRLIRITVWIRGLFSGFVTIERYGKWLADMNLLLILIRQMVALVRRALAEVCTVPVLLGFHCLVFFSHHNITYHNVLFSLLLLACLSLFLLKYLVTNHHYILVLTLYGCRG